MEVNCSFILVCLSKGYQKIIDFLGHIEKLRRSKSNRLILVRLNLLNAIFRLCSEFYQDFNKALKVLIDCLAVNRCQVLCGPMVFDKAVPASKSSVFVPVVYSCLTFVLVTSDPYCFVAGF